MLNEWRELFLMVNLTRICKEFYINWSEKNIKMWESCLDPSCQRYWLLVLPAARQGTRTVELTGKALALFVFWCRKPTISENSANGLVVKNVVSASRKLSHKRTWVFEGLGLSLPSLQVFKIFLSKSCQNIPPSTCCSLQSMGCDKRGKEHHWHSQHKHQLLQDRLGQLQLPCSGFWPEFPARCPSVGEDCRVVLVVRPNRRWILTNWAVSQHHRVQLSCWELFGAGRGGGTWKSSLALALGPTFLSQKHLHPWRLRAPVWHLIEVFFSPTGIMQQIES